MKDRLALYVIVVGVILMVSGGFSLTIHSSLAQDQRDIYWTGQDVTVDDGVEADKTYAIYNESGDNFIQQELSDNEGKLVINTAKFGTGDFNIVEPISGDTVYQYTVTNQNFGVEADKTIAIDDVVTYEMLSGRAEFDVNLSAKNLAPSEISDALQVSSHRITEHSDNVTIEDVKYNEKIKFDTEDIDKGEYELVWTVTDTIDRATVNVITGERYVGDADFEKSLTAVNQGDKATVNLSLVDSDVVEIQIGRNTYVHTVTLKDDDSDGKVGFTFNTLTAGNGNEPVEALSGTVITEQSDDDDLSVDILAPITYTMEARLGDRTQDTSILDIQPPETGDIEIYELSAESEYSGLNELRQKAKQDTSIPDQEHLAVKVEVSSIYSALPENPVGQDLEEYGLLDDEIGARMIIEEEEPSGINAPIDKFDLDDARSVYADSNKNELWVVLEANELPNVDASDTDRYSVEELNSYVVDFYIDEDENEIFDDDVSMEKEFSVENTMISPSSRMMDTGTFGDEMHVLDIEDPEITLNTNLADGRNITVVGESIDTELAIFGTEQVDNGEVTFDVNESQIETRDEFSIEISNTGETYDFIVGSSNVITSMNAPDEVYANEEFNVSVSLEEWVSEDEIDIEWTMDSLETKSGETATFEYPTSEVDDFSITVTGNSGDNVFSEVQTERIDVVERPPTPNPNITMDSFGVLFQGDEVSFNTNVDNVNSTNMSYAWDFNGETVNLQDSSITQVLESGTNTASVSVKYKGNTGKASTSVYAYRSTPVAKSIFNYFN